MCPVGRNIQAALLTHLANAERALEDELSQTTIADVLHSVQQQETLHTRKGDTTR